MRGTRVGLGLVFMVFGVATQAASVAAQSWRARIEVGADRFSGGSRETGGEHRSFRPYRPTSFGIGVERRYEQVAFALQLHYAEASLGLEGDDAVAAIKGVFTIIGVSPELVYRLVSFDGRNELRLHAGPLLEIWNLVDEPARLRAGIETAIALSVPLGKRFAGSVLISGSVTPSPFEERDLDQSYERRALWRRRFSVGLEYRL